MAIDRARLPLLIAAGLLVQGCAKCPVPEPLTVPSPGFGIEADGGEFITTFKGVLRSVDADSGEISVTEVDAEGFPGRSLTFVVPADLVFDTSVLVAETEVKVGFGQLIGQTTPQYLWVEQNGVRTNADLADFDFDFEGLWDDADCYVTTAVLQTVGGPDHGPELSRVRAFRDRYMTATPERQADVDAYYATAPGIVRRVRALPNRRAVLRCLFDDYLAPIIGLIDAGDDEGAYRAYRQRVCDLDAALGVS
jgi:hypothetical protein